MTADVAGKASHRPPEVHRHPGECGGRVRRKRAARTGRDADRSRGHRACGTPAGPVQRPPVHARHTSESESAA